MRQKLSIFLHGWHVFALFLFESWFIVHIFRIFLWSNVETHVVYCSQIIWMIDRRRWYSNFYMNFEHGWINSFIEVPYYFQALRKYSLEDFNSALISLLPRNYKHHVFLG